MVEDLSSQGASPIYVSPRAGSRRDRGRIYDFAETVANHSEFCGTCFDPTGHTLFVNQQGGRPDPSAVTYAITGPWRRPRSQRT